MSNEKMIKRIEVAIFIIFALFVVFMATGCKKNDPQPVTTPTVYKLSVIPLTSTAKLYINGVEQININETFIVNLGDEITFLDKGSDATLLAEDGTVIGKREGRTGGQIIINNQVVWENYCSCDTYHVEIVR